MRFNKYQPFAFVYFFVNAVALPFGLTWMVLLGPFFYGWTVVQWKKEVLLPLAAVLLPFLIAQVLFNEVELSAYFISLLNLILLYFFGQAFYTFLQRAADKDKIFLNLLRVNAWLCLLAIGLYFTPWQEWVWIKQNLTDGVGQFRRLKLFTYEASHYAMLFVPLFFYFLFHYFFHQYKGNHILLWVMLLLPLVLSFSIGVVAALLAALLVTAIIHHRSLLKKRRVFNSLLNLLFIAVVAAAVLFIFFRDNALFTRLGNIFSGTDTSGQGRTGDAFILALKIIKEKSEWWGIGPGQLKFVGQDIIRSYYLYYTGTPVAIPNAAAETLLVFGWAGFLLRMGLLLFLFFYTKVYGNYFRLCLFVFMFVYQFTGSFITNAAEYVIWIMAFTNVFRQFDVRRRPQVPAQAPALATASSISVS